MQRWQVLRTAGWIFLTIGAVAAVGIFVVQDQISRHRRELFSSHPLRRLAALGYLGGREATVDTVHLLRDFIAWEPRPLLRRRASYILGRMERRLGNSMRVPGEAVG